MNYWLLDAYVAAIENILTRLSDQLGKLPVDQVQKIEHEIYSHLWTNRKRAISEPDELFAECFELALAIIGS